jgi:hypothetical protein
MHLSPIVLLAATLSAQVPQPETKPAPALVVRIECAAPGSPVPRTTDPKASAAARQARRWEGRKLVWHIGDTMKLDTLADVERELRRIAQDPKSLRDSVDQPGTQELLPVLLRPGDDARWCDVTQAIDAAIAAGFEEISLDGANTPWLMLKMIDHSAARRRRDDRAQGRLPPAGRSIRTRCDRFSRCIRTAASW